MSRGDFEGGLVKGIAAVECPEGFERGLTVFIFERVPETGDELMAVFSPTEESLGGFAPPAIGVIEQVDEVGSRTLIEIEWGERCGVFAANAEESPILFTDLTLVVTVVIDLLVIPIADVDGAVGARLHINGAKPAILGVDQEVERGAAVVEIVGGQLIGADGALECA